jgi:hypothetical protein
MEELVMTTEACTRRDFLRTLGAATAALTISGCAPSERMVGRTSAAEKPNFIIIFTDDQGYADVGCFGAEGFETPNLDRMAAEGATRFYLLAVPRCPADRLLSAASKRHQSALSRRQHRPESE